MAKVFLADMEKERERMKMQLHNMIDPRSAARAPAANRMPHYKLRYLICSKPSYILENTKDLKV